MSVRPAYRQRLCCIACVLIAGFAGLIVCSDAVASITASTYPASAPVGVALENMSGSTQLIGPDADDDPSAVTNIGFDFWVDGVRYTQFSVNPNGICRLGPSVIGDGIYDNSVEFASVDNAPKICPYFDDLRVGVNGQVHYKLVGTSPNRKLVIEWLNMQVPIQGSGITGAGTFQLWLSETTGRIEFVYGGGIVVNADQEGYTVGLQAGAATNLASVTTATSAVSYVTANNSQTGAIASGKSFRFSPVIPAAPTNLTFTNVTSTSMRLNWTDNANNETGYVIYGSLDNVFFNFVTQTAANTNFQVLSGLSPATTYYWRIHALSQGGGLSSVLAGNRATTTPITITAAANGNWANTNTWAGGVVPTANDNVVITTRTVTINTNAAALNVTVGSNTNLGGTLKFETTTARTLTVGQNVTVKSDGTFTTELTTASTQTGHVLAVGQNLDVAGKLDFSTNPNLGGNNAAAKIVFNGSNNSTFSGSGLISTDIREIEVNKSGATIVELNFPNPATPGNSLTVRGTTNDSIGFLTLTSGLLKISGNFPMTSPLFKTAAYTIPATGGIWLNNANFVVSGTATGLTTSNAGLLRVTQGTYNIGIGAGDEMGGTTGATFLIEGGTVNVAGRLDPQEPITYTQTGGTVNVAMVGNSRGDYGSFEIFDSESSFTMSGGTINVINRNTGVPSIDYQVNADAANVTGGLLNIGGAGSPAGTAYRVNGSTPNLQVNANRSLLVLDSLFMLGQSVVNLGSIGFDSSFSTFAFAGTNPTTYDNMNSGTFAMPIVSTSGPALVTLLGGITAAEVDLFQGGFVHSSKINLTPSPFVFSFPAVVIGGKGPSIAGGVFDESPNFSSGIDPIIVYASQSGPRLTGFEIPATGFVHSLTIDNPSGVMLNGNDLLLTATGSPALTLTNGRLITATRFVAVLDTSGTVSRTNGYVDGNLRKKFFSPSSKVFEVGSTSGYSPVSLTLTNGSYPTEVTVRAQGTQHPNYPPLYPTFVSGLQRYWTIASSTTVGGNFTLNYLDGDVVGVEGDYVPARYNGNSFDSASFTLNTVSNSATVSGVISIAGTWTLLDDIDFDGIPTSYENAHGLDPNFFADAIQDVDGDGATTLEEYFTGTDPQSAASALRITSIVNGLPGSISIGFSAVANKTYRLEYKNSLNDANWQNAGLADSTATSTGVAMFVDAAPKPIYRVRLIQP